MTRRRVFLAIFALMGLVYTGFFAAAAFPARMVASGTHTAPHVLYHAPWWQGWGVLALSAVVGALLGLTGGLGVLALLQSIRGRGTPMLPRP